MTGHRPHGPTALLVATVSSAGEADRAIAAGADLIDAAGLSDQDLAALRARHAGVRLWHGSPAAADADRAGTPATADADRAGTPAAADVDRAGTPAAADVDRGGTPAAAVATAAVLAWLGAPAIRTRHVLPVRRAIDMAAAIAGTRLPACTTRGLA